MSALPQPQHLASDVLERHLTGRPVTVRPMTRRWISEVPSKIVKILRRGKRAQRRGVRPRKSAYGGAECGPGRLLSAPDGRSVLPPVLPPEVSHMGPVAIDPSDLSLAQQRGERCAVPNCRRHLFGKRTFLGCLPDGSPVFICPDHD